MGFRDDDSRLGVLLRMRAAARHTECEVLLSVRHSSSFGEFGRLNSPSVRADISRTRTVSHQPPRPDKGAIRCTGNRPDSNLRPTASARP